VSILGFLIVVSLALGGLAWLFFVWTVRSGQYEDPEGAKYRMLEDDEPAASAPEPVPPGSPTSAVISAAGSGAEAPTTSPDPSPIASTSPGPPSRRNGVHRP
jgi:cbb3-type cytochrome oxidase maturation protein